MFDLVNLKKPELMREKFPYKKVPKIEYDIQKIPENIFITDTTFRDGQQARPPYTSKQILELYRLMNKLDNNTGVIRQCEFFLYSEKDKEAVRLCQQEEFKYPEITGWIRANPHDLEIVKKMGLLETGILTSCSDYHIYKKMSLDRKSALDKYLGIVEEAMSNDIIPRCHFEDITRADFNGFVLPFAEKLYELSKNTGVDVKIRACDTLGYGLPFKESTLPRSVPLIFEQLSKILPSENLEWHGHNDLHMVSVNPLSAWLNGCSAVNCALLGFGERTGNTPLEAMIIHYLGIRNNRKIKTKVITEISDFLKNMGVEIPKNYPLVGDNFNTTSAGIHVDGILKNPEIYSIFDTKRILGVDAKVTITDKSGAAGVSHWINSNMKSIHGRKISKKHPGVRKIFEKIHSEYEEGRVTSISDAEMLEFTKKYVPEAYISGFEEIEEKAKEIAVDIIEEYAARENVQSMNQTELQKMMMEMEENNHFIQAAFITDENGKLVTIPATSYEYSELYRKFTPGTDCSDREWVREPIKKQKTHVTGFYDSRITKELCITASTPIKKGGETLGVLSIDLNFKELAKLI